MPETGHFVTVIAEFVILRGRLTVQVFGLEPEARSIAIGFTRAVSVCGQYLSRHAGFQQLCFLAASFALKFISFEPDTAP